MNPFWHLPIFALTFTFYVNIFLYLSVINFFPIMRVLVIETKSFVMHFTVFNAFTETESKFNKFLRSFELEQCICICICLLNTLLSLLEFAFVWLFACLFVFLFVSMVVMLSMILCNLSLILCICTSLCSYGLVFYTENLL